MRIIQAEDLLNLLRKHSYKEGEFTLASGKKSDFYINCKKTFLTSRGIYLSAILMHEVIKKSFPVNAVAGEGVGGAPLAAAISMYSAYCDTNIDTVVVRKATKDHGTMVKVERPAGLSDGSRVVLVEDVLTTGGSALRAVQALRDDGLDVIGVVALVDRLEGAHEAAKEANIEIQSLFTRLDFVK